MDACLAEIRRSNKTVIYCSVDRVLCIYAFCFSFGTGGCETYKPRTKLDASELTVENSLLRNFEALLRVELDPIWHRVGAKTKQLISDLGTLRRLLGYVRIYPHENN
jgi:hypothetical protein